MLAVRLPPIVEVAKLRLGLAELMFASAAVPFVVSATVPPNTLLAFASVIVLPAVFAVEKLEVPVTLSAPAGAIVPLIVLAVRLPPIVEVAKLRLGLAE